MAKKNPILQTNACEWKTSRLLVLLMGKLRLQSSSWYWYVSARRCCFLGWDKQDCPPPVPLPLISTLKILWPRCLNAAQGHPLPLLSCYPPCPGLWKACCGSQLTLRYPSVSAVCILRCGCFTENSACKQQPQWLLLAPFCVWPICLKNVQKFCLNERLIYQWMTTCCRNRGVWVFEL